MMAWYYGSFSCGCEGRVNIVGPGKDREWKKEVAFTKKCPDCYKIFLEEEKERKNKEAAEKAVEMELPGLEGSEKQISWATTLRQEFIEKSERSTSKEEGIMVFDYILKNKTKASWWIDNRYAEFYEIIEKTKEEIPTEQDLIQKQNEIEIKKEATVYPENKITNAAVEIKIETDKITVFFEKNETFITVVKSLNYKWEGIWKRTINELTGSAEDRAAELGNKLLAAGFPIIIIDEEIRKNAIAGNYEPECDRWIMKAGDDSYLKIKMYEYNEKIYKCSRKIPGSKWDNGTIVNIVHFEQIEEFAELFEFKFTKEVAKMLEEYKKQISQIKTVKTINKKPSKPVDGLQDILESSSDVLDDLKEE